MITGLLLGTALAASPVAGFPGFVQKSCKAGSTVECVAAAAAAAGGDAKLRARFDALLGELARRCDASAGEPEPAVPSAAFAAFNTESPGRRACATIAPLRLGATDAYDGPTSWARQLGGVEEVVPVDVGAGLATLERLCADLDARPTRERRDACLMLGDLAREVGGNVTRFSAEHYAERCRDGDGQRCDAYTPRPGGSVSEGWLSASVLERARLWRPDDVVDGKLSAIEAAIGAGRVDTEVDTTLYDVRRSLAPMTDAGRRAALEARIADLARRAAPVVAAEARRSRVYVEAARTLGGLAELAGDDETRAVARALGTEAVAFHAERAKAHAAAGRGAAARLHATLAASLAPGAEVPRVDVAPLRPPTTFAPRFAGTACTWAQPTAVSPGAVPAVVTVSRCEAGEREWAVEHVARVKVQVPRVVKERVVVSEPVRVCTDGGRNCTTTGSTVVEEREKTVYEDVIEHRAMPMVHRQLTAHVAATADVEVGGVRVSVPFTSATKPHEEAIVEEKPKTWTGTLDAQQALVRDELAAFLSGPVAKALARETARAQVAQAQAATSPEAAEEAWCRALLASVDDAPEAVRWLGERYGGTVLDAMGAYAR